MNLPLDADFKGLYEQLGFMNQGGTCHALHEVCSHAQACWSSVDPSGRPAACSEASQIYRPWVGSEYDGNLLVVGLNMNGWGGYDAYFLDSGLPRAAKELERQNLTFANEHYRGSFFQTRMLACAWHVLRLLGLPTPFAGMEEIADVAANPGHPKRKAFPTGYARIALTNAVKCGPVGSAAHVNGAPTGGMRERCPSYVLQQEIQILQPRAILTLGRDATGAVAQLRGDAQWKHFHAPHPAARGYRYLRVLEDLSAQRVEDD